ncbi:hypothetical protein DL764_009240 [Monosporascus ibericus]|uniref:Xylanolytic transcriptional activator regulatory domain-containing protein n=1 Tax=Monosporascus ibericus TaxID=155417 RepID=A0A4Q4SVH5_9PEZI|nr:hypothetical protein DL764_009240 [Monosporascus ibericus]
MTPTPPSGVTSPSGHSPEEQFRVSIPSANKFGRLKCNRGHPSCENCIKRGDTQSCVYATPTSRRKNQNSVGASSSPDDMQNRIDRLEGLVLSLMHGGANIDASSVAAAASATGAKSAAAAPSSTDSSSFARIEMDEDGAIRDDEADSDTDDGLATSVGILKLDADKGKSMYIGQEHWHTLLSDISEVKNFFASHKKDIEKSYEKVMSSKPATARDSPIFLLSAPPATEVELRAELPSKSVILTLVSRYFNSLETAASIIHYPTFQQQLQAHWQDPSKSSIMWIGLLYGTLCLAMLSYHKVGDEPSEWKGRSLELAAQYRLRTVQCLVVADYTKPVEFTVETLCLYLFGEYSSRWDADLGLWLIVSIITRIAMRQGYHRDSRWFPSITPFQGEMRRRAWALIRMADVTFSYQVSLPTMIYDHDTDTELPHNIFDEEFGQNSKVLPPSRPITEPTPIAYQIAKAKICLEFGRILQTVTRVGQPVAYDEILLHDRKLREVMDELPPHLKTQPVEGSHDPITLIMARLNINILYNKIMCILHKKHMIQARQNPRYAHSRRSAVEASLETLTHFRNVYRECQPNGRLRKVKWYVQSSSRDTLLPTMLVMLDLRHDNQAAVSGQRQDSQTMYFWTPEQRRDMIEALDWARDTWKAISEESVEGYKAAHIIEIMLDKIKNPDSPPPPPEVSKGERLFGTYGAAEMQPEESAAMTLGMLSGLTPSNFQSPGGTTYPNLDLGPGTGFSPAPPGDSISGGTTNNAASPFNMFTNLPGGGGMALDQSIDWDAIDNYANTTVNWGLDASSWGFFAPEQQSQQTPLAEESFNFMDTGTPGNPPPG